MTKYIYTIHIVAYITNFNLIWLPGFPGKFLFLLAGGGGWVVLLEPLLLLLLVAVVVLEAKEFVTRNWLTSPCCWWTSSPWWWWLLILLPDEEKLTASPVIFDMVMAIIILKAQADKKIPSKILILKQIIKPPLVLFSFLFLEVVLN